MPLTANGKIDFEALPSPQPGAERSATPTPPRTPVEATLVQLIAQWAS
ncbi:MAG: hypothetical protein F6J97_06490 [Leptolyngbya sp. SIO4C1]|nr:hypothetical protein [Leptolyngbya sp. SIO4C1]